MTVPVTLLLAPLIMGVFDTHRSEELSPFDRVVHHGLVCLLLLSFNGQQGVLANLRGNISGVVDGWDRTDGILAWLLRKLLCLVVLQQLVDASLAQ